MPFCAPQLVYSKSWNQSSGVGSSTIFTPSSDGMFSMNAYLGSGEANINAYVILKISWTDPFVGSQAIEADLNSFSVPGAFSTVTAVRSFKGGTPVTLEINYASGLTMSYEAFASIEQLA